MAKKGSTLDTYKPRSPEEAALYHELLRLDREMVMGRKHRRITNWKEACAMALKTLKRREGTDDERAPFWSGKRVGDSIRGWINGYGESKYGVFPFIATDARKSVRTPISMGTDLRQYFSEGDPRVGTYVVIRLVELIDTGKQSPFKKYEVQVDPTKYRKQPKKKSAA